MWAFRKMDIRKRVRQFVPGFDGAFVVRINAQEKIELLIVNGRHVVANHVADDRRFVPARDENGDPAFSFLSFYERDARRKGPVKSAVPKANCDGNEVVDAAEKKQNGQAAEHGGPDFDERERRNVSANRVSRNASHVLAGGVPIRSHESQKILINSFRCLQPLIRLTERQLERSDLMSFSQVVQELIGGTLRRHTFTPWELQLLLDFQGCRLRKSAKPDILRRYLKAVQQHFSPGAASPLRFSDFMEREQERAMQPRTVTGISSSYRY